MTFCKLLILRSFYISSLIYYTIFIQNIAYSLQYCKIKKVDKWVMLCCTFGVDLLRHYYYGCVKLKFNDVLLYTKNNSKRRWSVSLYHKLYFMICFLIYIVIKVIYFTFNSTAGRYNFFLKYCIYYIISIMEFIYIFIILY